jgi:transcriptional regulator of heat shock response
MFATPLNTRRKEILQAIVEAHIDSAEPVSSQVINRRLRGKLSPATIRNVMMELDTLGLIWQPHTSAGRIPTDLGYRFYIDSLMRIKQLSHKEKEFIINKCIASSFAFDEFLKENLRILSNFVGYTALGFSSLGKEQLYIERTSFILEQPEFQTVRKLQAILRIFESQIPLLEILRDDLGTEGVRVHIGKENPCTDIQDCSLVISNLKIKNRNIVSLGVIGPRRMSYAKVISKVGYVAGILSERIADSGIFSEDI